MFYVDDNNNEIENFGSNNTPLPQPEATTIEYLETSIGKGRSFIYDVQRLGGRGGSAIL